MGHERLRIDLTGYNIDLLEEVPDRYKKTGLSGVLLSGLDVLLSKSLPEQYLNQFICSCLDNTIVRDELREYEYTQFFSSFDQSESIKIDEPICLNEAPPRLKKYVGTYSLSKPFVCAVTDTTLFSTHAIAKGPDKRVILETGLARRDLINRKLSMRPLDVLFCRLSDQLPKRQISSKPLVPMVWGYGNYHHWIFNCLTMLQGINHYAETTGKECQLLIPPNPPSWIPDSLSHFGFDSDQMIEWTYRYGHVPEVIIPTIRRIENTNMDKSKPNRPLQRKVLSPNACNWLRETATKYISTNGSNKFSSHVIISRKDAGNREIANKSEVYDILYERGFESYALTELTFEEQVQLFAQADQIVSPHGAGLSNLVFASDCSVLEIFGTNITKPTYHMLSNSAGLQYGCITGEQPLDGSGRDDIRVNPQLLECLLEKII